VVEGAVGADGGGDRALRDGKIDINGCTEEVSRRSILLRVCSDTDLDIQEVFTAPVTTASTVPSVPRHAPSASLRPSTVTDDTNTIYGNRRHRVHQRNAGSCGYNDVASKTSCGIGRTTNIRTSASSPKLCQNTPSACHLGFLVVVRPSHQLVRGTSDSSNPPDDLRPLETSTFSTDNQTTHPPSRLLSLPLTARPTIFNERFFGYFLENRIILRRRAFLPLVQCHSRRGSA
jgi:hypothetical protein